MGRRGLLMRYCVPLSLVLLLLVFIVVMQRYWDSRPYQLERTSGVGPETEPRKPQRGEDTETPTASPGWAPAATDSPFGEGAAQGELDKADNKWSWLDDDERREEVRSWEEGLQDAKNYVMGKNPTQNEALKRYQRVLDAHPPRDVELHVKLTMGARMVILYNPKLGERSLSAEAVRWYQTTLRDFQDWPNHHDAMVAKIHLGDLYCLQNRRAGLKRASELYWSVIEVPEEQIVFDDPKLRRYNIDEIEKDEAPINKRGIVGELPKAIADKINARHREGLKQERAHYTTRIRRAAIKALAYKQGERGMPGVTRQRLVALKGKRPDDQQYQETLSALIGVLDKQQRDSNAGSKGKGMLDFLDVDQTISDIDQPLDNK